MALNAYLSLKGQKQGEIKGSVTTKGREGTIAVHGYFHEISSPRDPLTGLATGKKQHGVFILTIEADRCLPQLHNALAFNETLSNWNLRCYAAGPTGRLGGGGAEINTLSIVMKNAAISCIRDIQHNNLLADNAKIPALMEVSFAYQGIEWTWLDGGITGSDDWRREDR